MSLANLLRPALRLIPKSAVLPILGGVNKGLRWRAGAAVHACWAGTYERETQEAIRRLTRPGDVCYDLGANAGYFTLAFARLSAPGGRVFALEPLPRNGTNLLAHLSLNGLGNVTLLPLAVGAEDVSIFPFEMAESDAMGRLSKDAQSQLSCGCVSLDALVFQHGLPAPQVIKMDIEGGEWSALNGATRVLREHRPRLVLALHGEEQRRCLHLLREAGYTLLALDGKTPIDPAAPVPAELIATHP